MFSMSHVIGATQPDAIDRGAGLARCDIDHPKFAVCNFGRDRARPNYRIFCSRSRRAFRGNRFSRGKSNLSIGR